MTYPRIANDKLSTIPGGHSMLENDVDKKVDASISLFLTTMSQIGPELKGVSEDMTTCSIEFTVPRRESLTTPMSPLQILGQLDSEFL